MANPQDFQLEYSRSGLPILKGPQSASALSPEQARNRLQELLAEEARKQPPRPSTPGPVGRPQLPAAPSISAPAVTPVQPLPQALRPAVTSAADTTLDRMRGQAVGAVTPTVGPLASLLTQQTPLTERRKPARERVPEEAIAQALEGDEEALGLSEEGRLFAYYQRTKTPPTGWNPTPAQTESLIGEGLITRQDLKGAGNRQILWDALRTQQQEALQVPARIRALTSAQQRAIAPMEQEVRQELFKRGLSFSSMGTSIDWYKNLETLRDEYRLKLNQERVEEGKTPIELASPNERAQFMENVHYRASQTLQNIASASGLSVSDVNNPEIQKDIEWYWAGLEPFRAIFSPITFFEPMAGGGLAVSPEQAVYNIGEPRYIPQAQEAYGSLQKFGMVASTFLTPVTAMMESGEGYSAPETIAVIREGRADPFDHLDKYGYLLTGDEDNRANKLLGTAVVTAGLLFEPEPFTTLLGTASMARKGLAYAARKGTLTRPQRALQRNLPAAQEGRVTTGQFLENLDEAGEFALADSFRTLGQQAIGVRGSSLSAFGKFNRYVETLEEAAQKSRQKLIDISNESASVADEASVAAARFQADSDAANLAYAQMVRERALLDATLELRKLSPEEAAKVVDPKDLKKAKYTAESRLEAIREARVKALNTSLNKAQKKYEAALKSLNRENTEVGRVLQDILGTEVPAVGRTATGRVSARWYQIVDTDASGSVRLAESVPTVKGEDIVAVWDKASGSWVDPTNINPNRVYGGKRGGPLKIEDVSVGVASQRKRPAGSIQLPETSRRKYDLWFDVVDASGNRYRVRHPVSLSNWGRRADARKLRGEGFGIDIDQAQRLSTTSRVRGEKFEALRGPSAARDEARKLRDGFLVAQKEAEEATSAVSRINAWRNSRDRYNSLEAARKASEKAARKVGKKGKGAAARIREQVIKTAKAEKVEATAKTQAEVVLRIAEKTEKGLGQLQDLLKQRTGGILGSMVSRGLNDIIDYKKLRPEEIREAVQRIVTKNITDTKDGAGVINPRKVKVRLQSQYMEAPGATLELAERAIDLLKAKSPAAKKVLDGTTSGKPVTLTADEIAELQKATEEWIAKTWKQRQTSGPISYGNVIEREREHYYRISGKGNSIKNWFMKRSLRKVKDPITAARGIKARELGVTDDEIADVYIAASNMYDLGMDELLAVTNFGKMGPENATERMIKLMDNEERLVLRSSGESGKKVGLGETFVSEQAQQFDNLLGLESRFIGAKASLLDDLRVVPMRGLSDKAFYNKRLEIARSLKIPVDDVDPALVHRGMDEAANDQSVQALETIAFAFYPAGVNTQKGTGNALMYEALRILRGTRQADGTFTGGAKTFREYSRKMIRATNRIVGSKDESARAFSMAATGFTGAATTGYAKQLAARVSYAPINPDQAVALNRLILGNPQSVVNPGEKGYAAYALTEKQIDEGIEALAQLGLPLTERGIKLWVSNKGIRQEVSKVVKELVKVGSDPSANPYMIRGLLAKIDSLTEGSTKKLVGFSPVKPEMNNAMAVYAKTANAYDFLNASWRTSLTTGILYPNPAYWANNVMGDFSQMWFEAGLGTAARLSFNNFANNIPGWGRGIAERQAQMQAWAVAKGKDALPSPLEVFANPYLGKLLKGDDFTVVAKDGTRIRGEDLMREAIEDGIYATQVNQELFTLFRKELSKHGWSKGIGKLRDIATGDTRLTQYIADHANIVQQRQRMALYADFRMQGLSRQEARLRTLDALYDWKDGVSALEINTFVRLSPFYRFWKLGMRQMAGAFLEPVTKPLTSQLLKSMVGQTKIARTKQQILLFGGMPEIFGYGDMSGANSDASIMADFYAFRYPEYLDSKIIGTFSAMPADKNWRDWYIRETGAKYDSMARVLPTASILDLMSLASSLSQGLYHVGTKVGWEPFGKAPPNWASQATEPWVQQLQPFVQEITRGALDSAGVPTEYYSSNGQIKLSLGNQEVARALDAIGLGFPVSKDPDPGGKYTMNKWGFRLMELAFAPTGGLLTQVPRYIKAAKNPAWEDSWQEGVQWMFQSLFRAGAPTPYYGQKGIEQAARKVNKAFAERETADIFEQREDPRDPRFR